MREHIDLKDEGDLRHIVINREEKANALSLEMMADLREAISGAAAAGARAIVLSAAGSKTFCAGADLGDLMSDRRRAQFAALKALIQSINESTLPIICVVRGNALGAGCLFPVLSDIVIAADKAVFSFPELSFGMYPALMHAVLLEKLPNAMVYQLCVGAKSLTVAEARDLGLVTDVLATNDFVRDAEERLKFYAARLDAIDVGRNLQSELREKSLLDRIDSVEAILDRNLEIPLVKNLLQRFR